MLPPACKEVRAKDLCQNKNKEGSSYTWTDPRTGAQQKGPQYIILLLSKCNENIYFKYSKINTFFFEKI